MPLLRRAIAMKLLPAYAGGTLGAFLRGYVRRTIDTDPVVAGAYDAMRNAERLLLGPDAGLSAGQEDLLLASIFGELDAQPAASTASGWLQSLGPAVAAGACAVAFMVVSPGNDDLTARGGEVAPVGVRVRCVIDGAVSDEASAGVRQTGADIDCATGGLLAFSTTNLSTDLRYAFVVGIDAASQPVWLPPFTRDGAAHAMAPGTTDEVLGTLARVNTAGDVTLFVLLSDEPFAGVDVEGRLKRAATSAVPLAQLERLPVDVDTQARLTVRRLP